MSLKGVWLNLLVRCPCAKKWLNDGRRKGGGGGRERILCDDKYDQ